MNHYWCGSREKWPDSKTLVYWEIQKDLSGSDRLNQQCVSLFGKGLNVTDVHLYVKVSRRKLQEELQYAVLRVLWYYDDIYFFVISMQCFLFTVIMAGMFGLIWSPI